MSKSFPPFSRCGFLVEVIVFVVSLITAKMQEKTKYGSKRPFYIVTQLYRPNIQLGSFVVTTRDLPAKKLKQYLRGEMVGIINESHYIYLVEFLSTRNEPLYLNDSLLTKLKTVTSPFFVLYKIKNQNNF